MLELSNRPPLDGGFNAEAGPHGVVTQYTSDAENIIQFPSGRTLLPDSRAQSREPFIDIRELATSIFLGAYLGFVLVLICIGFIGYRAFIA